MINGYVNRLEKLKKRSQQYSLEVIPMRHTKRFIHAFIPALFIILSACSAKDPALTQYYRDVISYSEGVVMPRIDPDRPVLGNINAPVIVVEYSNFQCNFCADYVARKKQFIAANPDRAVFFLKHFARSEPAFLQALYFEALAQQSHQAAWQYYRLAFKNQAKIRQQGKQALEEIAASLPIDMEQLFVDLEDWKLKETVLNDIDEAEAFGFPGTPVFVINGYPVIGAVPWHVIEDVIEMVETRQPIDVIHEEDICEEEE